MKVEYNSNGSSRLVRKFQEGGAMPASGPEQAAPEQQGAGNPDAAMQQIVQAMAEALQAGDCNALQQVCAQFLQMITGGAPQQAEQPAPTFARRGGRLVRIG